MPGKAACREPENVLRGLADWQTKQYVTPLAEAFAAIGMGDHDLAFQRLEEAIDHKTNFVNMLAVEPFFPAAPQRRPVHQTLEKTESSTLSRTAVSLRTAYGSLLPRVPHSRHDCLRMRRNQARTTQHSTEHSGALARSDCIRHAAR